MLLIASFRWSLIRKVLQSLSGNFHVWGGHTRFQFACGSDRYQSCHVNSEWSIAYWISDSWLKLRGLAFKVCCSQWDVCCILCLFPCFFCWMKFNEKLTQGILQFVQRLYQEFPCGSLLDEIEVMVLAPIEQKTYRVGLLRTLRPWRSTSAEPGLSCKLLTRACSKLSSRMNN